MSKTSFFEELFVEIMRFNSPSFTLRASLREAMDLDSWVASEFAASISVDFWVNFWVRVSRSVDSVRAEEWRRESCSVREMVSVFLES